MRRLNLLALAVTAGIAVAGASLGACSDGGATGGTSSVSSTGAATSSTGSSTGTNSSSSGAPSPEPVFTAKSFTELSGSSSSDWVGLSLGLGGDVDGDGRTDLVVSSLSPAQGGYVGVFLGPITAHEHIQQADVLIQGEFQFNNAGQTILEAGGCDFDGDGKSDVLLGSPFADRYDIAPISHISGDNNGRGYVVFGGADIATRWGHAKQRRTNQADVTFIGVDKYDTAGFTVACMGDLDGDGKDEIAVAAPRASSATTKRSGAVYLIYGRARAQFPAVLNLDDADAILRGESASDAAGTAVAITRAGDFDGDGTMDLLIGTSSVGKALSSPGRAYIVRGGASLVGKSVVSSVGVSFVGETPGDIAGLGIATAGDLDGDKKAEILIGAPKGDGVEPGAGRAYLVRGRSFSAPATIELGKEVVVGKGGSAKDHLGEAVAGGADLDGDGVPDLVISLRGRSAHVEAGGSVYVLSGKGVLQ